MIAEMEMKFACMSEVLVAELTLRDRAVIGLHVKNKFISALLQVQTLRHSTSVSSGSRLESIGRAWAAKTKSSDEKSRGQVSSLPCVGRSSCSLVFIVFCACTQFLSLVVPYYPPQGTDWSTASLQNLTNSKSMSVHGLFWVGAGQGALISPLLLPPSLEFFDG